MSDDSDVNISTEEPKRKRRKSKKQRDDLGRLLIQYVQNGFDKLVALAISADANVNVQDDRGMTALHYAAAYGSRRCVRALVGSGKCDYLLKDQRGFYPFELAIEWGKDYAVARLLAKKQRQQALDKQVPVWEK